MQVATPVAAPFAAMQRSFGQVAARRSPAARPAAAARLHTRGAFARSHARSSSLRVVAMAAPPAKTSGPYAVVNRFRATDATSGAEFEALVRSREVEMAKLMGFVSASHTKDGNNEYTVSQTWESKEAYEKWMNSHFRRTSQPPAGIWQFRPTNKFSVPEDFCPFVRGGDEE